MRKISREFENPIDNVLIDCADFLNKYFYKLGFNANGLTTISLIFTLLSLYTFYTEQYKLSGTFFMLRYLFDCCDGHFARTYNNVTVFGDIYDHFNDYFGFLAILYLMYKKSPRTLLLVLPLIIVQIFMLNIHTGCQEKMYNSPITGMLTFLKNFCPDAKLISVTKYFGCGTISTFIALLAFFYPNIMNFINNNKTLSEFNLFGTFA